MKFEIHDEGGFEADVIFLRDWLPASAGVLEQQLGSPFGEVTHVVLTDSEGHARRFPPRRGDLRALVVDDPGAADPELRFPFSSYAHGITTIARAGLGLPDGIEPGTPVICLDVPSIYELADRLGVPPVAMLARVATHESSHVLRGHAAPDERVAHGYIKEGDAQRDTWQALHDLLGNPAWATIARAGRAVQVQLVRLQPTAYSLFGQSSPDRAGPDAGLIADPACWTLRPARGMLPLSRRPVIEVPVLTGSGTGAPSVGDDAYLYEVETGSPDVLTGPWHVIGISEQATSPHPVDIDALAPDDNRPLLATARAQRSIRWVHLQAAAELQGGEAADSTLRPDGVLRVRRVGIGVETRLLRQTLTETGGDFIERVAARRRDERKRSMENLRQEFAVKNVPLDERAFAAMLEFDPFEE